MAFNPNTPMNGYFNQGGPGTGFFDDDDSDPASAAQSYYGQIPGQTYPFYKPYFKAGKQAIPVLQGQYNQLLSDPTAMMNKIAGGYQQSPYFQQRLAGTLSGAGRSAAARGYATSPTADIEGMNYANQLTGEDFQNYLKNALGQYGLGLGGEEKMYLGGEQAGSDFAKMMAQALAQQGNLAFKDVEDENANDNATWQTIAKFAASAAGL